MVARDHFSIVDGLRIVASLGKDKTAALLIMQVATRPADKPNFIRGYFGTANCAGTNHFLPRRQG